MRMIIAGAEINEAVIEVIDTIQNNDGIRQLYLDKLTEIAKMLVEVADEFDCPGSNLMEYIRVLQMIRRDIETLANPPGINDPENDRPILEI